MVPRGEFEGYANSLHTRKGHCQARLLWDYEDEVPRLGPTAAAVVIAEIGLDMSRFPTAGS